VLCMFYPQYTSCLITLFYNSHVKPSALNRVHSLDGNYTGLDVYQSCNLRRWLTHLHADETDQRAGIGGLGNLRRRCQYSHALKHHA
jgi:hypothetical protein